MAQSSARGATRPGSLAADGLPIPAGGAANGRDGRPRTTMAVGLEAMAVGLEEKARRASSDAAARRRSGGSRSGGSNGMKSGIERSAAALHPNFLRAVVGSGRSRSSGASSRGSSGGSAASSSRRSSSGSRSRQQQPGTIDRCPTGISYHTRETLGTNGDRIRPAFSVEEYERMREENRALREEHARKYAEVMPRVSDAPRMSEHEGDGFGSGGGPPPSSGNVGVVRQARKQQPVTHSTLTAPVSNAAPSKAEASAAIDVFENNEDGSDRGGESAKENNGTANNGRPSSSGLHASNLPHQHQNAILQPIKNLSKLTTAIFRKPSDDEMSFFVTGEDGHVEKRAVALVGQESDEAINGNGRTIEGDGTTTIASGRTDGTSRQKRMPQSPLPSTTNGSRANAHGAPADDALKSVRKAAASAARLTRESVDALAHDVAPRIVAEVDRAARITAKAAMQATKESVDGLGMMVTDLAKTPARTNVHFAHNGRNVEGPGVVGGTYATPTTKWSGPLPPTAEKRTGTRTAAGWTCRTAVTSSRPLPAYSSGPCPRASAPSPRPTPRASGGCPTAYRPCWWCTTTGRSGRGSFRCTCWPATSTGPGRSP